MRPRPILSEEPAGGTGPEDHGTASEPVSAAAIPDRAAADYPRPRLFLPGAIMQLFREVKKAITGEAPAPEPIQRRRRTEDTGRVFRMTAQKIMRRAVTVPVIGHAAEFLADTLDWLHLWNWNTPDSTSSEACEDFHYAEHNHLSPHP